MQRERHFVTVGNLGSCVQEAKVSQRGRIQGSRARFNAQILFRIVCTQVCKRLISRRATRRTARAIMTLILPTGDSDMRVLPGDGKAASRGCQYHPALLLCPSSLPQTLHLILGPTFLATAPVLERPVHMFQRFASETLGAVLRFCAGTVAYVRNHCRTCAWTVISKRVTN